MDTELAKKIIKRIEKNKKASLKGGGKDFQGALKRLVGIWNDPSHALVELLQNADDADATLVGYKVLSSGILLNHNGNPFTEPEVKAICSIDDSTKDAEKHTGFMGIGFKAVFKLSDSPYIFCTPWKFRFSPDGFDKDEWGWILIPRWVDHTLTEIAELPDERTCFWLPYKKDLSKNAIDTIEHEILERFDSLCLMFLRNVKKIRIESYDERTRNLSLEGEVIIEDRDGQENKRQFKIARKRFPVIDEVKAEYPVWDSGRGKAKVREVVLAFSLDSGGNLQAMTDSPLYTFLPTDYFHGLRFAVQGDFILDTQRSRMDESLKWNRWLWRCVKELLIHSIDGFIDDYGNQVKGFKEHEEMRYHFYRILPSKEDFASASDKNLILSEMLEPFWDHCREDSIVITSNNIWVKPSEAVLTNEEIQELLDTRQLEKLTGRKHFVHPNVKGTKGFLNEIGVADLPEQNFLEALRDEEWINSRKEAWFRRLYAFLSDRLDDDKKWRTGWGRQEDIVKSLSIVRTTEGVAKRPNEVLFPPENEKELEFSAGIPGIFFVDSLILDDIGRKLLERLGVQPFSAESIIRTVILKNFEDGTWEKWTEDQLDKCIIFVKEWLKKREWKPPTDLQNRLGSVRIKTEKDKLVRANNSYFPEQELKVVFPEANFAKIEEKDDDQKDFFLTLNVIERPRVILDDRQYGRTKGPNFTSLWEYYWSWLSNRVDLPYSSRGIKKVTYVDSWDEIKWSRESGGIILKLLVKHWDDFYKPYTDSWYIYLPYRCQYDRERRIPSYFSYQLLETNWIPTTKGLMKATKDIFVPFPKLKKVAGELVPYVIIPEGWKEQEFLSQGQNLFRFLGLTEELTIEVLKRLMELVQEYPINNNLKQYISNIYQAFGRFLEEETGGEIDPLNLFSESETFESSVNLYWNDDRDLGGHFQKAGGTFFAWIPDGVERRYIESLFKKTGVKKISSYIHRELVKPQVAEPNKEIEDILRSKAIYIYSLLKHHKADKVDKEGRKLAEVKVMESQEKIEVLLSLDKIEKLAKSDAFYEVNSNVFYLIKNIEYFDIAMELARTFGLDFGYISDIEIILREKNNRIEERFQRQGIALLSMEEFQLPVVIEEGHKEEGEKTKVQKEEISDVTAQQIETQEGAKVSNGLGPQKSATSEEVSKHYGAGTKSRSIQRISLPYDERMAEEASNIERIIKFEENQGRTAMDVSKECRGYDLESFENDTGEIRFIELKTVNFVLLTPREYETAIEKRASYYLYIIDGDSAYIVNDPASSCEVTEIDTLETRWKILEWMKNSQKYHL